MKTGITVTINIASTNKHEGDAEFRIVVDEDFMTGSPKAFSRMLVDKFKEIVAPAVYNYEVRNQSESGTERILCNTKNPDLYKIARLTKHSIKNVRKKNGKYHCDLDGRTMRTNDAKYAMLKGVTLVYHDGSTVLP